MKFFTFSFLSFFMFSCTNNDELDTNNNDNNLLSKVYVVGQEGNKPRLWIDNSKKNLDLSGIQDYSNSEIGAYSIALNGTDIYVYGKSRGNFFTEIEKNYSSILWKNGYLFNSSSYLNHTLSFQFPIFSSNNEVNYVVNSFNPYTGEEVPKLFNATNNSGVPIFEQSNFDNSLAVGLFVNSGNTYIAFNETVAYTHNRINLYKNGAITPITNLIQATKANALYVYNNDVYIVGYFDNEAAIWKNGVRSTLPSVGYPSNANSVFVSNGDVYVCGNNGSTAGGSIVPVYWKNGVLHNLTDKQYEGNSTSVFVHNSDVYIAGYEKNANNIKIAKIWKNGQSISLSDGTENSVAYSVLVK